MSEFPDVALSNLAMRKGLVGGPFGSSLVSADYAESGVPVVRGANLGLGREVAGDYVFVSDEKADTDLARNQAAPGDLIFTQRGTLGQVAVVPSSPYLRYVVSQSQMRLTVDSEIADALYVYYACSGASFSRQVHDNAISTGVPHINLGILGRLTIPLPPVAEQRAIAEVLGALDDKIAENSKLMRTIDSLADARFAQLVQASSESSFPEQVDDGSETTIGELAAQGALTFSDGYRTKRAELAESGFRIIRVADIADGQVAAEGFDFVSVDQRSAIGAKAGVPGDILLTTKGTVGRIAVLEDADEEVVYSPQICFFRVHQNDAIERVYLRRWLASDQFKRQALYLKSNTDMADYINLADMRSLKLALPDLSRQRELAQVLEPLESLLAATRKESRTLAATRDALLPRLMSGELRVRDAERQVEAVL